jgi:hypothetical protein
MDDDQLLKITSAPTDVETLRLSHARLLELVEEQRKLLDEVRRERDEARNGYIGYYAYVKACNPDAARLMAQKHPWLEEGSDA